MKTLSSALALVALFGFTATASAAPHGAQDETIRTVINEWTGQRITSHIAGDILRCAGREVEYVSVGHGRRHS